MTPREFFSPENEAARKRFVEAITKALQADIDEELMDNLDWNYKILRGQGYTHEEAMNLLGIGEEFFKVRGAL